MSQERVGSVEKLQESGARVANLEGSADLDRQCREVTANGRSKNSREMLVRTVVRNYILVTKEMQRSNTA